jgi:GMP reductase
MIIEPDNKLDFNNVLIRPKRTTLNSRNGVSLERTFNFPYSNICWKGTPIISANMDTTGTFEVYNVLSKYKCITALNKFYTVDDYLKAKETYSLDPNYFMVSTGITESNLNNLKTILSIIDCNWICIDVANGYMESFIKFCYNVRQLYPDKIIVAGYSCQS